MADSLTALIVAGEASGDRYGAALAAELQRRHGVHWFGIGGDQMQAAGVELITHARSVAVVGIFEVVRHLPRIYGFYRRLLEEIDRRRPRFAVLVDFPDFNLRLARQLLRRGIPVIYFVAPQMWAWRPGRVKLLQRYVRKLLCIFPFEEEWFRQRGVEVEYVGHPLLDAARPTLSREEFLARHQLKPEMPTICLLPGSRNQEVERHLPLLLEAAAALARQRSLQFVLARAATVAPELVDSIARRHPGVALTVVAENPYNALAAATLAVVASGTITVEALLLEVPLVVVYRVAASTWHLGRPLVQTPHYSMVNLLAGQRLAPELIQSDFTPARVAAEVERLLDDPAERRRIQETMGRVKERLGPPGAIERAAKAVAAVVGLA
ncbi:MAG TPA: lipid-A-disaccharide synthase [Candidatus Acidoferrales bacterium]|nr:lipid-A-disaccharide synthase [Candidatus Acidoferrales bacterium]